MHRCLTGAVVIVRFELAVEMNLVQIGANEFFHELVRLAVCNRQSRPYSHQKLGDAIKAQRLLNSSCPSRGDPFPPVFVMDAAEDRASHDLVVFGQGMSLVTLQRWEYRDRFRNPRSEAQMRAPLVVMSNPL
jgi:hypothetical protein